MAPFEQRSNLFTAVMRESDSGTIIGAVSIANGALVISRVRAASVVEICADMEETGEEEEQMKTIVTATRMTITTALR